jgi:hypothetical protein
MLVEIFVHMSLLNMVIYIDVLGVHVTIYINGLKYLSHLSWFNISDIYLALTRLMITFVLTLRDNNDVIYFLFATHITITNYHI